jgi:hypothetical protein
MPEIKLTTKNQFQLEQFKQYNISNVHNVYSLPEKMSINLMIDVNF